MRCHFTFLCKVGFRRKFGLKLSLKLGLRGKIKSPNGLQKEQQQQLLASAVRSLFTVNMYTAGALWRIR